ncbi:uncharacterized protein [Watersipora subatra]|uniref:uncharacterized protein n=1 Tax=Watersipora subatra TaxID=2589382 RepID=UPI00355AEBC5
MACFNFALYLVVIIVAAFPVTQGMTIVLAQNETASEAISNETSAEVIENTTTASYITTESAETTVTQVGSCSAWGSTYTPDVASDCKSFIQSAPGIPDTKLDCPEGLKFDISTCACNFEALVSCPP